MLKTIAIVTLLVRQLAPVEGAYREHLDYRTVRSGEISAELAGVWDSPGMAGRDYVLMGPASGAPVYLRFVKAPAGQGEVRPFMTHGWNATEILVQDPDGLARRLDGTPFRVIGPPADLLSTPDSPRAMQALGPAGELLYFTRIIPGGSGFDLGTAAAPVDRVFITVVGGPSLAELRRFYGQVMGLPLGDDLNWRIDVLARAHGLPVETTFPLAVAIMPKDFLVEMDEYPASARPRKRSSAGPPPGMSIVSFTAESLDGTDVRWRRPPRALADFPYSGRRVAVTEGPVGEWVEVIETTVPNVARRP
jgi:hypothetical protein